MNWNGNGNGNGYLAGLGIVDPPLTAAEAQAEALELKKMAAESDARARNNMAGNLAVIAMTYLTSPMGMAVIAGIVLVLMMRKK